MLNSTTTLAVSLNIVSSIIILLACIICLTLLTLIIYRLITKRMRESERLSLCLTINTLCAFIFMSIMIFVYVNISTMHHDFNIDRFIWKTDSIECRLCGYIYFSLICSVYWSYALQAFFRCVRVIYSMHSRINHIKIYLFLFIPIQWILAFVIVIPLLTVLNSIHILSPNEIYCGVRFEKISSLVYASVAEVWIPVLIISACYLSIIRTVRQGSIRRISFQRNKRDLKIIHRIIIMILILSIMNLPTIIDLIVFWASSNTLDPLIYRITWLSLSIGTLILSAMVPQLVKHVHICKDCHKSRIGP